MRSRMPLATLALVGLLTAMAVLLSFFRFAPLPQGGEISLEMLPILLAALARGFPAGTLTGILYGAIHCVQDPHVIHPFQYLLDYPAAYGVLGVAGLFNVRITGAGVPGSAAPVGAVRLAWRPLTDFVARALRFAVPITAACVLRFLVHTLSGLLFFLKSLEPKAVLGSLAYNATYMVPEYILALILLPPLVRRLGVVDQGS